MAAHPLPSQSSQQENERLCNVVSTFVNLNAPEIGNRPPLPFQKLRLHRALVKETTQSNDE
jgi:hypothetical protein